MNLSQRISCEGYSVVPNVLNHGNIAKLLDSLKQMDLHRSRAGARHILSCATVFAVANAPCMLLIAREVLGISAFSFRATLFDKSQTANWLVAWHQDTALPLRKRLETPGWGPWSRKDGIHYAHAPTSVLEQMLALRLHLDNSLASNGPLRVLPGTHKSGVLSDEEVIKLARQLAPIECTANAGDVLAMRPLVVHASSKSLSTAPRRVLHIEYAANDSVAAPLELAIT